MPTKILRQLVPMSELVQSNIVLGAVESVVYMVLSLDTRLSPTLFAQRWQLFPFQIA